MLKSEERLIDIKAAGAMLVMMRNSLVREYHALRQNFVPENHTNADLHELYDRMQAAFVNLNDLLEIADILRDDGVDLQRDVDFLKQAVGA